MKIILSLVVMPSASRHSDEKLTSSTLHIEVHFVVLLKYCSFTMHLIKRSRLVANTNLIVISRHTVSKYTPFLSNDVELDSKNRELVYLSIRSMEPNYAYFR